MADVPILEKDWQRTLVELLTRLGYSVNHTRPGRSKNGKWSTPTTAKGWPDLVALRGSTLLAIEVKGPTTKVEPEQLQWLVRFAAIPGAHAFLLRPDDDFEDIGRWFAYPDRCAPKTYGFDLTAVHLPT